MRSYALFLALAVLHARAASIPAPETEKKLPPGTDALDDVSLDNNESEQELADSANTIKEVGNNLRNTAPENVPVEIIEVQPVIKTIAKEDSNDYVPDNDDSSYIKRVEIDLKNPGPPQRQEHDSQNAVSYFSYVNKERAVAAIKQSIAESQNIFTRGIQDVTQKFDYYFANNDKLDEVSKNIQSLRKNFDSEVIKLSNTINTYLKPEIVEQEGEKLEIPSGIKEVENHLKTLETSFNSGVGMLSEGVELLSILREEDDKNLKISGKADNENVAAAGTATGTATATPPDTSPLYSFLQSFNATIFNTMSNFQTSVQNLFNQNQNQNQNPSTNVTNQSGFNPINLFQNFQFPNPFQQNQNQNPQQPQQGTAPAGVQSDDAGTTERPNILQQIQNTFQNIVSPPQTTQQQTQQNQNPITQFFSDVNNGIANFFQGPRPQQTPGQTNQQNAVSSQPAASNPAPPAADVGTNAVPVAPAVEPAKPEQESQPAQSAPSQNEPAQRGPFQQIVQNNPIIKGITDAVQRIQGLSNPPKPVAPVVENSVPKGHDHGGANTGDSISGVDDIKKAPAIVPETIQNIQNDDEPAADVNKTE